MRLAGKVRVCESVILTVECQLGLTKTKLAPNCITARMCS
jgi:hypothetical protein